MNDDCYQRNVLSLSYNYLYQKLWALIILRKKSDKFRKKSDKVAEKFNILCGNDESYPLTEMQFQFSQ